jgi:hypothetical protein
MADFTAAAAAAAATQHGVDLARGRVLRTLVREVLLPAYNSFDRDASDMARHEQLAEEQRECLPRHAASGGARTEAVANGMRRKGDQNTRVLTALLEHLGMDASLLIKGRSLREEDGNWLGTLHEAVQLMVPAPLWRLYRDCDPTETELALMMSVAGRSSAPGVGHISVLLQPHRQRGLLPIAMALLSRLIVGPLLHTVSFAVPNEAALLAIAAHAPLVECGAGTGYWSALLQRRVRSTRDPYPIPIRSRSDPDPMPPRSQPDVLCCGGPTVLVPHVLVPTVLAPPVCQTGPR